MPPKRWAQWAKINSIKKDPDGLLYLPPKTTPCSNKSPSHGIDKP